MRTYLKASLVLAATAALACTRLNPAFADEAGESDAETRGSASDTLTDTTIGSESSDSAEVSTSGTDSQTSSTAPSTTDPTDTMSGTDTAETGEPVCDLPADGGLRFKIFSDAGVGECPDALDRFYFVEGFTQEGFIAANPCAEGCGTCDDGLPIDVEVYPADLSQHFPTLTGSCIHVQFDNLVASASTYCEYDKAFISDSVNFGEELPLVIASSGDGAAPPKAVGIFDGIGLSWQLIKDQFCDCPDDDPCCLPANPPSLFGFDIGNGVVLRPGELHDFPSPGGGNWVFDPWQAQLLDSCGANLEVSWMLTFEP